MVRLKKRYFLLLPTLLLLANCKEEVTLPTLQLVAALPSTITESSGLIYWEESIWTHNDSGNENELYQLSPTNAQLLKNVTIENTSNTDWEDVAQDENYIYVGNFGNNDGDRTDLRIHILPKSTINNDPLNATTISFTYPDQTDWTTRPKLHDFDCEAMIVLEDGIHLFSKNHLDQQTKHYKIPKTPGTYEATLVQSFNSQGLITGADYDSASNSLFLLGYTGNETYQPFVWILNEFEGTDFFAGAQQKIDLAISKKTEGICFATDQRLFISCEGRSQSEEALYVLDVAELLK